MRLHGVKYKLPRKYWQMLIADVQRTNRETGEITRTLLREIEPKPKKKTGGKFILMLPESLERLAGADLRGGELRLLLQLSSQVVWKNYTTINRGQLQKTLKLTRQHLYLCLKGLHKKGYITIVEQDHVYVDPQICWRGYGELLPHATTEYKSLRQGVDLLSL